MVAIWFVISVVSSICWLGYMGLYVHGQLAGNDFSALDVGQMAAYVGLAIVPIWVIWQIFGLSLGFSHYRKNNARMTKLLEQTKKNQDYTDLIVRVMLDAEHEIKDGFIINKFDVFIADLNELLADILLRSNAASTLQTEQLWARVKNGERWVIAKALIEAEKRHTDFSGYLLQKAQKDPVFKGTMFEFCARYQDLSALLEKHDRDRVFINIVETGVLGKVYSMLAPISDSAYIPEQPKAGIEKTEEDFSQSILNMPEPESEPSVSIWSRLNPFHKDKSENEGNLIEPQSDEDFFAALQKNLNAPAEQTEQINNEPDSLPDDEPERMPHEEPEPEIIADEQPAVQKQTGNEELAYMPAPSIHAEKSVSSEKSKKPENDNFVYPFGGWMNEDNYK